MRNPNRWTYSILFLAAAWAGTAGLSQAAALTPTSGDSSNPASSNQAPSNNSSNAPSFPKQSDVQPFNPNTAAEISSSDKAAAVGNVQTQGSVKAGTLQNAPGLGRDIATGQASGKRQYAPVKTGKVANTTAIPGGGDPGPIGKSNKKIKNQKGGKVGKDPGPPSKLNKSALAGGVKAGRQPGPTGKLNNNSLNPGLAPGGAANQIK